MVIHAPVTASLASGITDDPLLAYVPFALRQTFYPLGFPVEIETNSSDLLRLAGVSWPSDRQSERVPPIVLRIGVTQSENTDCPPAPVVRAQRQLLTVIASPENYIVCDLRAGFAFGWLTTAALIHESYLRYCLLDAAVMTLLTSSHVTPIHAACVSFGGRGLLLNGRSGAGKSTLAYACARSGWIFTSDDCSYLLWSGDDLRVRGHCGRFRMRPSAADMFPELAGREITPRLMGKPSIEVSSADIPGIATACEVPVHAFVALDRDGSQTACLERLSPEEAMELLEESLFPLPEIRALQLPTVRRVLRAEAYRMHYSGLGGAIECLQQLALSIPR